MSKLQFELCLELFSPLGEEIRNKREHQEFDETEQKMKLTPINPDIQLVVNGKAYQLHVAEHVAQVSPHGKELILRGEGLTEDE